MGRKDRFRDETFELGEALDALSARLDELAPAGAKSYAPVSRYANQHATEEGARTVAEGGYLVPRPGEREGYGTKGLGLQMKALAEGTGSAGGFVVPVEYADGVLRALRARSVVYAMGPRTVPVEKLLNLVSLSSGATASYVAENAAIPTSEPTFAETAMLSPKALTALIPVSNRLLEDADNPSIDEVIRTDLAEVLALRADLAFLRGSGTGAEPLGIRNVSGVNVTTLGAGNGATPSFDDFMDLVGAARLANAPFSSGGFVFHPRTLNTIEQLKDGDGNYLKGSGLLTYDPAGAGGTLLGFRFRTTTQIPVNLTVGTSNDCSEVFWSSDWNECWIGEQKSFSIDVSAEATYSPDGGTTWVSAFQNDQSLFRARWRHDVGLRRPGLFHVLLGVRP